MFGSSQQQTPGGFSGYGRGYPSSPPNQFQSQSPQNSLQNAAAQGYGQTSPAAQAFRQTSPWSQATSFNGLPGMQQAASGLATQQFQQILQLLTQIIKLINSMQYSQSINPFQPENNQSQFGGKFGEMAGSGFGNLGSLNPLSSSSFGTPGLHSINGNTASQSLNPLSSSSFGTPGLNSFNGNAAPQQQLQQPNPQTPGSAINF
ncbi:uncharacterized protein LOC142326247 isoform X2 [Lycorma delicatula]|uniref:uncharacterized protein LOC142326247 isoform X2 n=1 Tax=Lycorma delicatula TaxID=130591 RepID=UPI003F50EA78